MPKEVIARVGDTLCGIAIDAGFLDCSALRALAENAGLLGRSLTNGDKITVPDLREKLATKATAKRHRFVKKNAPPVSIRFVHGSPDKKYLEDDTLTVLNVSNVVTNRGGNGIGSPAPAFPPGFGFQRNGHADVDTFKIEVVDPLTSGSLTVVLEALKRSPLLDFDGSERHVPITGVPDAAQRKRDVECKQVSSGHVAFRSRYMRLVVDSDDFNAASQQTLLVTDLVDAGEEDVEILQQKVRATYVIQRCPGTGGDKCQVSAALPVGEDVRRVKLAVHVLRDPTTGVAVATLDQARRSCLKYIRQLYAQANMTLRFAAAAREIPPPTNLLAVANGNGQLAAGGQTVRVRVRIDAGFDEVVRITTRAGAPPVETATALAGEIATALAGATPPVAARVSVSENPPINGQGIRTADVLVGNPIVQSIRLTVLESGDVVQPVTVGRITSTTIPDFGGNDSHVGTIEERVLVKNFDTGSDRVDLFVVGGLGSGALGEAFTPNFTQAATQQPLASMVNTGLVFADTVVRKDHFHTTIPHEVGHVLMDANHAIPVTELMTNGSPVGANERVVGGPKRISDPPAGRVIVYDDGQRGNPVTFLRTKNAAVIE